MQTVQLEQSKLSKQINSNKQQQQQQQKMANVLKSNVGLGLDAFREFASGFFPFALCRQLQCMKAQKRWKEVAYERKRATEKARSGTETQSKAGEGKQAKRATSNIG